jgi:hypothetical protein
MTGTFCPGFDWYSATVEQDYVSLVEQAATVLADESPKLVKGILGYSRGYELRRDGSRAALVLAGGHHREPHIVGTGPEAEAVAAFIRARTYPHRVARVDACLDTDEPGAYETLQRGLRAVALSHRVKMRLITDPDRPEEGSSLYLGSPTSEVLGRLYEKGKEPKSRPANRPDWVRFETQFRPGGQLRRVWAASASADAVLGAARWSRSFVSDAFDVNGDIPPPRTRRKTDLDGSLDVCADQYGGRFLELMTLVGGDLEAFALDLLMRVKGGVELHGDHIAS